jgi:hypothetical protein
MASVFLFERPRRGSCAELTNIALGMVIAACSAYSTTIQASATSNQPWKIPNSH